MSWNNKKDFAPGGFPHLGLKPMTSMAPQQPMHTVLPQAVATENPTQMRPEYYQQQRQEMHNPFQKIQALFGHREDDITKPRK